MPSDPQDHEHKNFAKKEIAPIVKRFLETPFVEFHRIGKYGASALILYGLSSAIRVWVGSFFGSEKAALLLSGGFAVAALLCLALGAYYGIEGFHRRSIAETRLRQTIKRKVVHQINPDWKFSPRSSFPKNLYQSSGLFSEKSYDRASAEDHIRGVFGETPFSAMEIHTQEKIKTKDARGRQTTRWKTIFRGLVFVADFNKNFSGKTIVQTDTLESHWGGVGRSLQRLSGWRSKLKLVELENPMFEKAFKVLSTDPVEARYILSSNFMEQIMTLRQSCGGGVQMGFLNDQVVVSIPRNGNFLDGNLNWQNVEGSVIRMISEIENTIAIIEILSLNEDIWNKGIRKEVKVS